MAKKADPARKTSEGQKLIEYAEALGTSIGRLRRQIDKKNGQRKQLVEHLSSLVSDAQTLLADIGHTATDQVRRLRGQKKPAKRKPAASNPAGALALKAKKPIKGVTEARRRAMSAPKAMRPTPQRTKRMA